MNKATFTFTNNKTGKIREYQIPNIVLAAAFCYCIGCTVNVTGMLIKVMEYKIKEGLNK